uniref:Uncharacterized protein n=1 Tax=Oryza nivara TaxID=4536 RepID=A0A0E0GRS4_ORYNI
MLSDLNMLYGLPGDGKKVKLGFALSLMPRMTTVRKEGSSQSTHLQNSPADGDGRLKRARGSTTRPMPLVVPAADARRAAQPSSQYPCSFAGAGAFVDEVKREVLWARVFRDGNWRGAAVANVGGGSRIAGERVRGGENFPRMNANFFTKHPWKIKFCSYVL